MPPAGARPAGLDRSELVAAVRLRLADVPSDAALGVAVSGGPDSAALARLVLDARPELAVTLLHVRHGLRDDTPDAEAAQALAALLGRRISVRAVQVAPTGGGPEAAARAARYAALAAMAEEAGLAAVCVGHTADDQAETVLLNLVRGAGLGGLAGMRHDRVVDGLRILRPLLDLRRADVRSVASGLPTVEDPTNDDPDQRRARARLEVMPVLARLAGGPGDPVGALTRLAALARDEDDVLAHLATTAADELLVGWGPVTVTDGAALAALPRALARRVVRRMGDTALPAQAVEAVLDLAEGQRTTLPGGAAAQRSQGWLTVGPQLCARLPERGVAPDGVALPEIGRRLRVDAGEGAQDADDAEGAGTPLPSRATTAPPAARPAQGRHARAWMPLPAGRPSARELCVRSAVPSDEIRAGGRLRVLRDLLSDRGVPVALRPLVPVVVASDGRLLWVPGIATADDVGDRGPARLVLDR